MAQASGVAVDGLISGSFTHRPSGITYKLTAGDGRAWLHYERTLSETGPPLRGKQLLSYYIGSGHRGRTYLFEKEGLWFESPVNYYAHKHLWDMAPNYGSAVSMPSTLPVDSNCLHCHASDVQTALSNAPNKYAGQPFKAGGVRCGSCHGDATAHLAQRGKGPIVNPARLTPVKRDSVCLQCHLEGDATIYRTGKSLAMFKPGDSLEDFAVYFVKDNQQTGGRRATSQYEALLQSVCKRTSGDKLTCTTCHDPHGGPATADRTGYYRNKCLTCHDDAAFAKEHHPEKQDCVACHMAKRDTLDIPHDQLTDHNIRRQGRVGDTMNAASTELITIGGGKAGDRELGLAYAQVADHGDRSSAEKALKLLQKAEQSGSGDAELHVQLGFLEQLSGAPELARREYVMALKENPYEEAALANLAVIDAADGQVEQSVAMLEKLVHNDPAQTVAGLNLAFLECKIGNKVQAIQILHLIERFNPDSRALHQFLDTGNYGNQRCMLR